MHTPLRIVVVDNDADALDLVSMDLRLEGHRVVATGVDARAALSLVEAHAPDVLVVDHRMAPGPSGLEVAQRVARSHPAVRVIVYSNYQDVDLVDRVRSAGAEFLPKGNLRRLRRAVVGEG